MRPHAQLNSRIIVAETYLRKTHMIGHCSFIPDYETDSGRPQALASETPRVPRASAQAPRSPAVAPASADACPPRSRTPPGLLPCSVPREPPLRHDYLDRNLAPEMVYPKLRNRVQCEHLLPTSHHPMLDAGPKISRTPEGQTRTDGACRQEDGDTKFTGHQ